MNMNKVAVFLLTALLVASGAVAAMAQPRAPQVAPGKSFTVEFPEMPPTMARLLDSKNTARPSMTVFLPTNYNARARFPLLIFLKGGSGGNGNNPDTARKLVADRDFICVDLPLFKYKAEGNAPTTLGLTDADCRYMWSLHKQMLDKLGQFVPNTEPTHSVLGGFSNGSYATARMIVQSDGEVLKRFSAFIFVESGAQLLKPDLLALLKGHSLKVYCQQAKFFRDQKFSFLTHSALALARSYPWLRRSFLGPGSNDQPPVTPGAVNRLVGHSSGSSAAPCPANPSRPHLACARPENRSYQSRFIRFIQTRDSLAALPPPSVHPDRDSWTGQHGKIMPASFAPFLKDRLRPVSNQTTGLVTNPLAGFQPQPKIQPKSFSSLNASWFLSM